MLSEPTFKVVRIASFLAKVSTGNLFTHITQSSGIYVCRFVEKEQVPHKAYTLFLVQYAIYKADTWI